MFISSAECVNSPVITYGTQSSKGPVQACMPYLHLLGLPEVSSSSTYWGDRLHRELFSPCYSAVMTKSRLDNSKDLDPGPLGVAVYFEGSFSNFLVGFTDDTICSRNQNYRSWRLKWFLMTAQSKNTNCNVPLTKGYLLQAFGLLKFFIESSWQTYSKVLRGLKSSLAMLSSNHRFLFRVIGHF